MTLTMKEKKSVGIEFSKEYRKASKKRKGEIIREFINLTGYNASYAARKLRKSSLPYVAKKSTCTKKKSHGRKRKYPETLLPFLLEIWRAFDYICGKRMEAGIADMIDAMCRFGELSCSREEKELLLSMSASTIDRMLRRERDKLRIKGRSTTKPGTLLKNQIPIRLGNEWDEDRPGYVEIDLVAHCGESVHGDYLNTLSVIDIKTCWCETRAVLNKAQKHVFEALKVIRERLPFPLLGIDSDNGSEFINDELMRYCNSEKLTFTRSRPYRKNDNCHIEQKNWSIVRQNIGYGRFETKESVDILNELYESLRLHTNFFMPCMKLIDKKRNGSRITKHYEKAMSPYRRVLLLEQIENTTKKELTELYDTLNPVELRRKIESLREKLYRDAKTAAKASLV